MARLTKAQREWRPGMPKKRRSTKVMFASTVLLLEAFDDPVAFEDGGNHGTAEHELHQRLIEGLANVLLVVLLQQFAGGLHLLELGEGVALGFNPAKDGTGKVTGHAVGLDQDEGALNGHNCSNALGWVSG